MTAVVLMCGRVFDGVSDSLKSKTEILVQDKRITAVGSSVQRPPGAQVIDLSDRTVSPGFIDTHVHLAMDASNLAKQTLLSSASKALKGLSIAREYMRYGFTTVRDLGCIDPDWPTVDLRNAINAGLVEGPRLIVAAHILSASAGHADLRVFTAPAGHYLSPRLPMTKAASRLWSGASTPSAEIGLRPRTLAGTSALAMIRRG